MTLQEGDDSNVFRLKHRQATKKAIAKPLKGPQYILLWLHKSMERHATTRMCFVENQFEQHRF
jgi:hypothetical protein